MPQRRGGSVPEGEGLRLATLSRMARGRLRSRDRTPGRGTERETIRSRIKYLGAKRLANKGAKPTDLWAETTPANPEVLANSFAEYLAFGPGAANFVKLDRTDCRPDENGNPPSIRHAFEAAGLERPRRCWNRPGGNGRRPGK